MAREIRHPDGTVQHVYAGPNARPWWRRHLTGLTLTTLIAIAVLLARLGGH